MKNLKELFVIIYISLIPISCLGQVKGDLVVVSLFGRKIHTGQVKSNFGRYIIITDPNGRDLEFTDDEIQKIEVLNNIGYMHLNTRIQSRNRNNAVISSALGLKADQIEFRNIGLLSNQISVGVSDNFMVSAGVYPFLEQTRAIFGLSFTAHLPVYKHVHVGLTSIITKHFDNEESEIYPIQIAKISIGQSRKNFTFGFGTFLGNELVGFISMKTPIYKNLFIIGESLYNTDENFIRGLASFSYSLKRFNVNAGINSREDIEILPFFSLSCIFD